MKAVFSLALVASLVSTAVAQTSVPSSGSGSSACAADYIVETCLSSENAVLAACVTTDYTCKCNAYGALVTCFNNCPDDTRVGSYQGQQQIFCSYATQFATTTIAAKTGAASGATDSTTPQTTMAPSSTTGSGSVSTTASGTASAASKTNSAADVALNAGGILAAVAGVVMAVL